MTMRWSLSAVLLALVLATPALPQTAPSPSAPPPSAPPPTAVAVADAEAIPVEQAAPPGSSTPGPLGVAVGVFVAVVVIGLVTFAVAISSRGSS
jgi:hypothetical protein